MTTAFTDAQLPSLMCYRLCHGFFLARVSGVAICLIVQVADYYGVSLCLCGIIVASEQQLWVSALWSLGVLILGSPIACIYMALRAAKSSIVLKNTPNDYYSSS